MRYVVTGASGFIGKKLLSQMSSRDLDVIPVSRSLMKHPRAVCVEDYGDSPEGDVLIHLAANSTSSSCLSDDQKHRHFEIKIAEKLLSKRYQHIIMASSAMVYGDSSPRIHTPRDVTAPDNPYAKTKLEIENILTCQECTIARLSNLFGHGMSPTTVIASIIEQAKKGTSVKVRDISPVRDFLWAGDATDALVRMALSPETGIYNVGSGKSESIGRVLEIACEISGSESGLFDSNVSSGDYFSTIKLDINDTVETYGWTPKVDLRDGIKMLLQ